MRCSRRSRSASPPRRVGQAHQDRASTPEQLEAALDRIDRAWIDMENDLIDLRLELRGHVDAEQWAVLFPAP